LDNVNIEKETSNPYENKYGSREVYNYEIYDNNDNLITRIDTVQKDALIIVNGRCLLRVSDALIDKKFLDYVCKNTQFEGYIKANTIFRDSKGMNDHDVFLSLPKVKLINYIVRNVIGEFTVVSFMFETFPINDSKDSAFVFDVE